jgi:tripartite-type tricarboxylate transporter receptor subunit TctC
VGKGIFIISMIMLIPLLTGCAKLSGSEMSVEDYYKGKTIELVTTGSPGGYDDLISQVVASYLSRDTGSKVNVVNKRGAGGMEGINYIFKDTPDGLSIGNAPANKFVGNKVMKEPSAEYEIDKLSYILGVGKESIYFFVSAEGPYKSMADIKSAKNLKIGGGSPSGSISLGGLLVTEVLELDARVITGFDSESDRALAVKRGELLGYCMALTTGRANIEAGILKPLFVLASQRDPLMPQIPAITELTNTSGEKLELIDIWTTTFLNTSLFVAPGDLHEERLTFLQGIAEGWIEDENFRKEINQVAGYEIREYFTGKQMTDTTSDLSGSLEKYSSIIYELIKKYRD